MGQPWKKLLPIGLLAMVNPPEALGIYLVHQCDKWRLAELDLQNKQQVRYQFRDITADVTGLVENLLRCAELECVQVGRSYGLVLDELNRADYHVEYIPSIGKPQHALFSVLYKDKILLSNVIELPAHRIPH